MRGSNPKKTLVKDQLTKRRHEDAKVCFEKVITQLQDEYAGYIVKPSYSLLFELATYIVAEKTFYKPSTIHNIMTDKFEYEV